MVYSPLNGKQVNSSFLGSLQPEALVVPDPAMLPQDVSHYPLAVVFNGPKLQEARSAGVPPQPVYRDIVQKEALQQPLLDSGAPNKPTTKDHIKCIHRKNSYVCYETSEQD
ncbi:uncharacterized protein LOC135384241 [Ornithodoros turicata]|uniref:uncharacterized protein LOC135384241 n=1 Tax=Ornithodoros turicata TaxID=34597 RepID=UPI00313892AA